MKTLTVLGSTGSIGVNTLDVVARHPDQYRLFAITAHSNVELMYQQCLQNLPRFAVMVDEDAAVKLRSLLHDSAPHIEVKAGKQALTEVSEDDEVDYVMAAIVGAAGLLPTLAAARSGKRVLLANKEALVMSGQIFMDTVLDNKAELLPIDSEHNAIFQCMPHPFEDGLSAVGVRKILLTASGGPFRDTPLDTLSLMTPEQACKHPNWVMGRKISVDSATMMNKGLEVIEACWLFHTFPEQIQVVLHPQSVIHSMVQYSDGSVLAQLGNPDMRTPIAYGMSWPFRIDSGVEALDLFEIGKLDFERPDENRFPCLRLAREAMLQGGTCSAILNAANEIAVSEFLNKRLSYTGIAEVIEATIETVSSRPADTIERILEDDSLAREAAREMVRRLAA